MSETTVSNSHSPIPPIQFPSLLLDFPPYTSQQSTQAHSNLHTLQLLFLSHVLLRELRRIQRNAAVAQRAPAGAQIRVPRIEDTQRLSSGVEKGAANTVARTLIRDEGGTKIRFCLLTHRRCSRVRCRAAETARCRRERGSCCFLGRRSGVCIRRRN